MAEGYDHRITKVESIWIAIKENNPDILMRLLKLFEENAKKKKEGYMPIADIYYKRSLVKKKELHRDYHYKLFDYLNTFPEDDIGLSILSVAVKHGKIDMVRKIVSLYPWLLDVKDFNVQYFKDRVNKSANDLIQTGEDDEEEDDEEETSIDAENSKLLSSSVSMVVEGEDEDEGEPEQEGYESEEEEDSASEEESQSDENKMKINPVENKDIVYFKTDDLEEDDAKSRIALSGDKDLTGIYIEHLESLGDKLDKTHLLYLISHSIRGNNTQLIQFLMDGPANASITKDQLRSFIYDAILVQNFELVEYFFSRISNLVEFFNLREDGSNESILMFACRASSVKIVHYLIEKGAPFKENNNLIVDSEGLTIFHHAVDRKDGSVYAHLFAQHYDNVYRPYFEADVDGGKILNIAARRGNIEAVKLIHENFPSQMDYRNADKIYAFQDAVYSKNLATVKYFISELEKKEGRLEKQLNAVSKTDENITFQWLFIGEVDGDSELDKISELLKEKGHSPNEHTIMSAIEHNYFDVLEILVGKKQKLPFEIAEAWCQYAAVSGTPKQMDAAIAAYKKHKNAPKIEEYTYSENDHTLLHEAAYRKNLATVSHLFKNYPGMYRKDADERYPVHLLLTGPTDSEDSVTPQCKILKAFKEFAENEKTKKSITSADIKGVNLLYIACERRLPAVVFYLLKNYPELLEQSAGVNGKVDDKGLIYKNFNSVITTGLLSGSLDIVEYLASMEYFHDNLFTSTPVELAPIWVVASDKYLDLWKYFEKKKDEKAHQRFRGQIRETVHGNVTLLQYVTREGQCEMFRYLKTEYFSDLEYNKYLTGNKLTLLQHAMASTITEDLKYRKEETAMYLRDLFNDADVPGLERIDYLADMSVSGLKLVAFIVTENPSDNPEEDPNSLFNHNTEKGIDTIGKRVFLACFMSTLGKGWKDIFSFKGTGDRNIFHLLAEKKDWTSIAIAVRFARNRLSLPKAINALDAEGLSPLWSIFIKHINAYEEEKEYKFNIEDLNNHPSLLTLDALIVNGANKDSQMNLRKDSEKAPTLVSLTVLTISVGDYVTCLHLLKTQGITAGINKVKKLAVQYIDDSTVVSDILEFISAPRSTLPEISAAENSDNEGPVRNKQKTKLITQMMKTLSCNSCGKHIGI